MKKFPLAMIAVLLTTTMLCFTIILLVLNMNSLGIEQTPVVIQTPVVSYVPQYSLGETFTIDTTEPVEVEPVEEGPTSDEQQIMENAEDAIMGLSEQIGELEQRLDHIENDIDDEDDADEILDDIDDVNDEAEDVLYSISKWNNYLMDIAEADNLRDDLDYLQLQADEILDDCNDLEDDAEDLE
ncbi:MAG: hypothetical protein WC254_06230 [Candidatus Woesearchaeota archaeon]|jgi:hypothetical protein